MQEIDETHSRTKTGGIRSGPATQPVSDRIEIAPSDAPAENSRYVELLVNEWSTCAGRGNQNQERADRRFLERDRRIFLVCGLQTMLTPLLGGLPNIVPFSEDTTAHL